MTFHALLIIGAFLTRETTRRGGKILQMYYLGEESGNRI
jgi:hypothetical protein